MKSVMSEERLEVISRLYGAFADGDMGTVAGLIANTEWHEAQGMPYGGRYKGFAEVFANVFGPLSADVEGFSARPDELLRVGNERVLALGRYQGKGTGGHFDVAFAHLWTVENGEVSKFVQFVDTHQFRKAVRPTQLP